MKKSLLPFTIACMFFTVPAGNSDRNTVADIFAENNLDWDIDERTTFEGGRITALDLDNRDISTAGMVQLIPEIGNLTELRVLTINDGQLSDLPPEIFDCTKLIRLEIKNNNLLSIPVGIDKLTVLTELDLRNNELENLPSDIVKLKSIFKMQLWGNNLTSLPSKMGDLSTLRELYLNNNRLVKLPPNITKLELTYLDISFNYLRNNTTSVDAWLYKYNRRYKSEQYISTGRKRF